MEKIVVGISGRGRTLKNLLQNEKTYAYHICGVFSSRPDAEGLEYARSAGLPILVCDFTRGEPPELVPWIEARQTKGIVLAGFTRKFPTLPGFEETAISIHPSLLPAFGGKGMFGRHVHEAVFAARENISGATVHIVDEVYDEGRFIAQIKVDISDCISVAEVQDKVFVAECWAYPRVIDNLVRNSWQVMPMWSYEDYVYAKCS